MDRLEPGAWIQTFTGRKFWPMEPDGDDLDIRDIAHALSNQCRFAGHVRRFYSVAEHSVRVSLEAPPSLALAALMHDASEAYLMDIPRPIKHLLEGYRTAEDRLMGVIAKRFGFKWPIPEVVWEADDKLLAQEASALMVPGPIQESLGTPAETCSAFGSLIPQIAEALFLKRFNELQNESFLKNIHIVNAPLMREAAQPPNWREVMA